MFVRRVIVSMLAVLAALLGIIMISPSAAQAAPLGTTAVVPSIAACSQSNPESNVACAAAFTGQYLAAHGAAGVVRETVLVGSGALGAWPTLVGGLCGFSDVEGVFEMGAHHCDRTTFISLGQSFDRQLMSNRVHAIAVLAHESAHGVEQRAGIDLISPAFTGHPEQILPTELAGDCWAANAIRWYIQRGMLPASAQAEARALFMSIGHEGEPTHGSGPMRAEAFDKGFAGGPAACNVILGQRAFPQ